MKSIEYQPLNDITLNITDGKHGDCNNQENSECYFISVKDIGDNKINYNTARQITYDDFIDTHKRTKFALNDILITNSGTIGKMVFIDEKNYKEKTTFQKSVAIIKPDPKKIFPKYLYWYLNSEKKRLIEYAGGTTQKNLLLRDIRNFNIHIPKRDIQIKISNLLTNIDEKIRINEKINNNFWFFKVFVQKQFCGGIK